MKIFKPLGPRVLVQRIEDATPKSELIEVVSYTPEVSMFAVVLAVGKLTQSPELKEGNVVVLSKYCGSPVQIEISEGTVPVECAIVVEDDILAIVEGL